MGYQKLTREQWQAAVNALGADKAEAWRARSGLEVEGMPPVTPMVTQPLASATTPAARPSMDEDYLNLTSTGDTSADLPDEGGPDFGVLGDTDPAYRSYLQRSNALAAEGQALRKSQFEQGKAMLDKMYAGPSRTQQLFALSQAFLAPRRTGGGGFAQTLSNVGQALGGFAQQSQEAKRSRAEALMRLQQSYDTGALEGKGSALERELKLIEIAARQRKASQPSVQLDQQGRLRQVPKQVEYPTTKAEFDALPIGTFYVVPDGSGMVVQKTKM